VTQVGKIVQVIGPVVDVEFSGGDLPPIYGALKITNPRIDDQEENLIVEVAQHLGDEVVRCVAMDISDGLVRGMKANYYGEQITMPVGRETLGRILNVVGKPVDEMGPVVTKMRYPIHRPAPAFFRTIHPDGTLRNGDQGRRPPGSLPERGEDRPLRSAGVGKTVVIMELIHNVAMEHGRVLRLCRRGRAYPRRERPLAGDEAVQSSGEGRIDLWPDDRAPRSPRQGRPFSPDRG